VIYPASNSTNWNRSIRTLERKDKPMDGQKELFSVKDNPAAAKCADKLVDLYDDEKELIEKLEAQEAKMAEIMKELGKKKVNHKGHTIELKHIDAKEKIQIKGIRTKEDTSTIAQDGKRIASKN
jgi:seryl-tRNA synthetase